MTKYQFNENADTGIPFSSACDSTWNYSLGHRKHVMSLINEQLTGLAPNCAIGVMSDAQWNGLDMSDLVGRGHKLTLIDDSAENVNAAVQRQLNDTARSQVEIVAPLDISGVRSRIKQSGGAMSPDEIVTQLNSHRDDGLQGRFDVGVSLCVMGQVMSDVVDSLGPRPEKFEELIVAVRNRSIDALIDSVKPGGRVIFVFLVLSNKTLRGLDAVPAANLSAVLSIALEDGNHFHGAHPLLVHREFARQQVELKRIDDTQLAMPWTWNAVAMHYAVTAITAKRV